MNADSDRRFRAWELDWGTWWRAIELRGSLGSRCWCSSRISDSEQKQLFQEIGGTENIPSRFWDLRNCAAGKASPPFDEISVDFHNCSSVDLTRDHCLVS